MSAVASESRFREERYLEHHVIHIEATFRLGTSRRLPRTIQSLSAERFVGFQFPRVTAFCQLGRP
jgi:hypothetical protein